MDLKRRVKVDILSCDGETTEKHSHAWPLPDAEAPDEGIASAFLWCLRGVRGSEDIDETREWMRDFCEKATHISE